MNEFMISTSVVKNKSMDLFRIQSIVNEVSRKVDAANSDLRAVSIDVSSNLSAITAGLSKRGNELEKIGEATIRIAARYDSAENTITTFGFSGPDVGLGLAAGGGPGKAGGGRPHSSGGGSSSGETHSGMDSFIDNYEYTYSEDNIKVPISPEFLDKDYCMAMAQRIMDEHGEDGKCNGMSVRRMAKELYAHALGYYAGSALQEMGFDGDFIDGLLTSGVDADLGLGDGLEVHYNLLWYWMDPFDLGPTYF